MRVDSTQFEIEQVVGSGAMGTVFRARDRASGALIALKILRTDRPGAAARFEREAEVLGHLRHPAIVRYLGHGVTPQGESFLAMEWLDGETVKARLRQRGLTVAETVGLGLRVAAGLAAAHAAGVVHRDVKPANLMLVGGDVATAKLVDFGIARWDGGDTAAITTTGDVLGTVAYMAPEQAAGTRQVGPAADVFGLGCVLYECAAGRPPSVARRPLEAGPGPLAGPGALAIPRSLPSLRPDLPAALVAVVERMLARDPAQRPADGAAAVAALAPLAQLELAGLPAPVRAASPTDGFAALGATGTTADLSATSTRLLDVLGRHVPMPLPLLRSQCARLGLDAADLGPDEVARVVPVLAEAAARFAKPGRHAAILEELRALIAPTG